MYKLYKSMGGGRGFKPGGPYIKYVVFFKFKCKGNIINYNNSVGFNRTT